MKSIQRIAQTATVSGTVLFSASLALGQAAPPQAADDSASEDEIVVLSPFEVTPGDVTGYQATDTLAGTRIRTDLRDVGTAISVVTPGLMADIGATDNSTLLQYTTNAEVAGVRGTYAGLGNGASVDESGNLRAPGGAQRVRGLSAADNTRDFFVTDIPWDSYNVDRIDIQRGPNSILFGLGSPAGIVNASLRNATFRTGGEVEGRVGSYESWRARIDYNQEIIDDVLAIRVAGLWDNEKFRQNPAFEDDERAYVALRFDPKLFKDDSFHTSIRAKYEHGEIDANRPRIIPPNDNITAWFRPSAVSADNPFGGMGRVVVNNGYDAWRNDTANIVAGDGRGLVQSSTINYQPWLTAPVNQQQPFWLIDGTTDQLYRVYGGYINTGARNTSGGFSGSSVGLLGKRTSDLFYGIAPLNTAATNARLVNYQYGQYRQQSLMDPTIFDFYNTLLDGSNKYEFEGWDAFNIDFTQTAFNDRLGLQLSYDRQKYERGGSAFLGGSPSITMDVLKNFQDYYLTNANGTTSITNPNFGRPYTTSTSGGTGDSYESDRKYLRGSLFGEFRSDDFLDNKLLVKLLGKHRLNVNYSNEEYSTETRTWIENANSREWNGYWNGTDGNGTGISERPPTAFIYLGSSIMSRDSASGANIPGITTPVAMEDANVYVFDSTWQNYGVAFNAPWAPPANLLTVYNPDATTNPANTQASNPANYVGWNSNFRMNLMRYDRGADQSLLTKAQMSLRETTSYASSWQGFFWNDALVATAGWRYDEVKGKGVTAPTVSANRSILNLQPNVYRLPDEFPANQIFKDHSTAHGVVLHINRLIPDDPLPINISLSYSKSDNFQVTDTRRDIYGSPIGNPTGETRDYGILLSTKDNKYSFRAIKYKSSVANASSGISDPGGIGRIIQQGLKWRNVFLYDLSVYDWATRGNPQTRNTWGGPNGADTTITEEQGRALEDAAIGTWNEVQAWLTERGFFQAWGFTPQPLSALTTRSAYEANPDAFVPPDTSRVYSYTATAPQGFTVTADTESEGYEFELTANPLPNWRIAFNASETEAVRSNVGGALLDEYITYMDEVMAGVGGSMPQFGNINLTLLANVWNPWRGNYTLMKLQEAAAAPEIRKWRYNIITNYTFQSGFIKNVGIGASYRWQDKVVIGYPVVPLSPTQGSFDLNQPYYGPAEDAVDLWASYERKINEKIRWKIQLNIRNAFANDGLIPISVEPDGHTWASVRVKPTREWFLTNTFSF